MESNADTEDIQRVSFLFTEDEFIAAYRAIRMTINRAYDSWIMRLGIMIGGHIFLFASIVVWGLWLVGNKGENGPIPIPVLVFNAIIAAFCVFGLYRSVYFYRRHLRSLYRSFPLRDEKVLYTFTPLRYSYEHRQAQGSVDWRLVPKVTEFRDGFVIHTSGLDGHWIPKHALREPFGNVDLANLLRSRVTKYKPIDRSAALKKRERKERLSTDLDSRPDR
jgi:hypothetical protein